MLRTPLINCAFQAIEQPELLGDDSELRIDVTFDKDAKTLSIADNGIGMNRDEAISHLGTIAEVRDRRVLGESYR